MGLDLGLDLGQDLGLDPEHTKMPAQPVIVRAQ